MIYTQGRKVLVEDSISDFIIDMASWRSISSVGSGNGNQRSQMQLYSSYMLIT